MRCIKIVFALDRCHRGDRVHRYLPRARTLLLCTVPGGGAGNTRERNPQYRPSAQAYSPRLPGRTCPPGCAFGG